MVVEYLFAVEWKGFEHVFESHAVICLFPHLLGKIKMAFWRLYVGIDAQGQRTIHDEFGWIEKRHQKLD